MTRRLAAPPTLILATLLALLGCSPEETRPPEPPPANVRTEPDPEPTLPTPPPATPPEVRLDRVQLVRLRYRGADWDDGLHDADPALLAAVKEATGRALDPGPHSVLAVQLDRYEPGAGPVLLTMTGSGFIQFSPDEAAALRRYLLGGGMLLADAGSRRWDPDFRKLMRAVFPDRPLMAVARDDPIFREPYALPHGAPALWHHGGMRALGVRDRGRWCVFYHPGDLGDAWKPGTSGLQAETVEAALQTGVNIVHYAYQQRGSM